MCRLGGTAGAPAGTQDLSDHRGGARAAAGLAAERPEPPQRKQLFLIQLAWADALNRSELDALLLQYEEEVQMQLLISRAHPQAGAAARARFLEPAQARCPRETLLWKHIQQNWADFYERELAWVRGLRASLAALEESRDDTAVHGPLY